MSEISIAQAKAEIAMLKEKIAELEEYIDNLRSLHNQQVAELQTLVADLEDKITYSGGQLPVEPFKMMYTHTRTKTRTLRE